MSQFLEELEVGLVVLGEQVYAAGFVSGHQPQAMNVRVVLRGVDRELSEVAGSRAQQRVVGQVRDRAAGLVPVATRPQPRLLSALAVEGGL